MAEFNVYAWDNEFVKVQTGRRIKEVSVLVVTGDEVVYVDYADGTEDIIDAGKITGRLMDFNDGHYILHKRADIARWMNFKPDEKEHEAYSYQRLHEFEKR